MTSVRAIHRLLRSSLALVGVVLIGLWVMEPIDAVRQQAWDVRKEQWLIDCVPTAGDGGIGKPDSAQRTHQESLLPAAAIASPPYWYVAILPPPGTPSFHYLSASPATPHRPAPHLRGPPTA